MRQPAFTTSVPLLHAHQHRHSYRCSLARTPKRKLPRLTADPPTKALPLSKPRPSPLQPSQQLLSTPLTSALYSIISGAEPPESLPVSDSAAWHTPLFDATAREIPSLFKSFLSFAVDPTITIYSISFPTNSFTWMLSFNYPLPWRPRVSVAGTTETDDLTNPTRITDHWFTHPVSLVLQALPRIPDLIWLYPGPHAEVDDGTREVLLRKRDYKLERFSAMAEVRVLGSVKKYEKELMFATPALPYQAFEGGLRRREQYAAVSPIALREISGDDCEWAVPVPTGFTGSSATLLPAPGAEGVRVEIVEERIMAVVRFGGFAMREVVESKLKTMLAALKSDGVDVGRDRVWVRVYDSKVGFNGRGLLAMAMYGSSTGIPRRNEIAIDVTGLVQEEFWKNG